VITNNYAAEYGRYPAGIVDVVTLCPLCPLCLRAIDSSHAVSSEFSVLFVYGRQNGFTNAPLPAMSQTATRAHCQPPASARH
jgi:hypothetical protein